METTTFATDLKVLYVEATTFPDDVKGAHERLHNLLPITPARKYLGISRPENGTISYKAGAEELVPGEGEKLDCKTLVLKSGDYITVTVHQFMKDPGSIGRAFSQLVKKPGIDPEGYCVEWYLPEGDVKCMIRIDK